jgi:hemophore-related protein
MIKLSLTTIAAAGCGLALSLTAGARVASAEPDISPAVNSTCNYAQVVAALNAQYPSAAAQFNASPEAQAWLHDLVDAPPPRRRQMLLEMANTPEAAPFQDIVVPLANTCHNY